MTDLAEILKKDGLIYLKGDNEFIKIRAKEYCNRIFYKDGRWFLDECKCDELHYKKYLEDPKLEVSTMEVFIAAENQYYDYKQRIDGTK